MFYRLSELIHQGFASYHQARRNGQMIFWWISLIAIYTPFEDFIAAWLPVPEAVQTGVRFIPELIFYLILIRVLCDRWLTGKRIETSPIDPLILAFFLAAIISIILNQSAIGASIANLRSIWRYLAVYYTIINITITKEQIGRFLNLLKVIGLIQAAIASIQLFLPSSFKMAMAAGNCEKAATKNASCGTFLDSANLSGFLLLVITVTVSLIYVNCEHIIPPLHDVFTMGVFYFGLFASKKRAALLMSFLLIILVFVSYKRVRNTGFFVWFVAALGISIVFIYPLISLDLDIGQREVGEEVPDITSYFFTIFSPEYWDHTLSASRGWVVNKVCQTIVESSSWFGFGPDSESVIRGMGQLMTSEDVAKLERDIDVFDDPYWFAILGYFGFIGLSIYWLILFRLYQVGNKLLKIASTPEYKVLLTSFCTIVVIAFFYSFVERIFKTRDFSLYFWILAGLVVNVYNTYLVPKK
jgi:hypothetical protein